MLRLNKTILILVTIFAFHVVDAQELPSVSDYYALPLFWSPDGTKIAQSNDSALIIIDSLTGQSLTNLNGHTANITAVSWDANSSRIATGSSDQSIRIWDISGTVITIINIQGSITSLAWSSDNATLVSARAASETTIIEVWDTTSWQLLRSIVRGSYFPKGMVISPDSTRLAISVGATLSVLDLSTLSVLYTSQLPVDRPNFIQIDQIDWNLDGSRIMGGTLNGLVYIWESSTGDLLQRLTASTRAVEGPVPIVDLPYTWIRSIQWSPNDRQVLAASGEGTVTRWDASSGDVLATTQLSFIDSAAWSPYAGRLAFTEADQLSTLPQIAVPTATIDELQSIASACNAPTSFVNLLSSSVAIANAELVIGSNLDALPEGTIPLGCEADLRAVAEALTP